MFKVGDKMKRTLINTVGFQKWIKWKAKPIQSAIYSEVVILSKDPYGIL